MAALGRWEAAATLTEVLLLNPWARSKLKLLIGVFFGDFYSLLDQVLSHALSYMLETTSTQ